MKRLSILLLVLSALLALGGCALEPAYRYNANAGGGYYYGQSAYGNADTVIYGSGYYADPWGWRGPGWGWYPAWGYGRGWRGYGGVGFGATYTWHPRHRYRRQHARHDRRRGHVESRDRARPANRPPPANATQRPRPAPPQRVAPVKGTAQDSER